MKQKNIKIKFSNNKLIKLNEDYTDAVDRAGAELVRDTGKAIGGALKLIAKTFWSTTFGFAISFGKRWYETGSLKEGLKLAFKDSMDDIDKANKEADRIYQSTNSKQTLELFLSFASPAALAFQKVTETEKEKFGWLVSWDRREASPDSDRLKREEDSKSAETQLTSFLITSLWICKVGEDDFTNKTALNNLITDKKVIKNSADVPCKKFFKDKKCKKLLDALIDNSVKDLSVNANQVYILKKIKEIGDKPDKIISFLSKRTKKGQGEQIGRKLEDLSVRLRYVKSYTTLRSLLNIKENKFYSLRFNNKSLVLEEKEEVSTEATEKNPAVVSALYLMYIENSIKLYVFNLYIAACIENYLGFASCIASVIGSGNGLNNPTGSSNIKDLIKSNVSDKEESFYKITNELQETKAIYKDLFPDTQKEFLSREKIEEQIQIRSDISSKVVEEFSTFENKFEEQDFAKQINESNLSDQDKLTVKKLQMKKDFIRLLDEGMTLEKLDNSLMSNLNKSIELFDGILNKYTDSAKEKKRLAVQKKINTDVFKNKEIKKINKSNLTNQIETITKQINTYNKLCDLIEKGKSFDESKYKELLSQVENKLSTQEKEDTEAEKSQSTKSIQVNIEDQ